MEDANYTNNNNTSQPFISTAIDLLNRIASSTGISISSLILILITFFILLFSNVVLIARRKMRGVFSRTKNPGKKSKVYTKVGDKGFSSLCDNQKRKKNEICFHVIGSLDELGSFIGNSIEHLVAEGFPKKYLMQLRNIQSRLLDIGATLAGYVGETSEVDIYSKETVTLEAYIDEIEEYLEPLNNFLLPSGGLGASSLHICRAVCRRAERWLIEHFGEKCEEHTIVPYINRMSDYFFVLARLATKNSGNKERIWQKYTLTI